MIREDYVGFEIAKLLKEKGFEGECLGVYFPDGRFDTFDTAFNYNLPIGNLSHAINAPTLQMAMKWLREIYKLEVRSTCDYDKDSWWGSINPMFEETDENSNIYQKALRFDYQGKSYEESCEAAIKYCLENLI